jgi:hypothetical protein
MTMSTDNASPAASLQNPQGANFKLQSVPNEVSYEPVGLVAADGAPSKGMFYRRRGSSPKVGVHLMHPRTDQTQNYNIVPLALAGYAVLGRASRWPNNDVATVHEPLLLDIAAGIEFLRSKGCEQVILLGNSGGSSLAAFYQAQAKAAAGTRLTDTPAGDPFDLNKFDLPPADGIVLVAGHIGQGLLLGKMLDPSVVDERDPVGADPSLDLYDPANGFDVASGQGHYDPQFLKQYRSAQLDRVRRLDAMARRMIETMRDGSVVQATGPAAQRQSRAARAGWHMIIYRTTADPAFVDLSIEPDDRIVFSYVSARPDLENYGENGFARCVTPRAWLSTWSAISSRARTADNLSACSEPLLIVHYAGDAATRLSEVAELHRRSVSADKTLKTIHGIDHYGMPLHGPKTRSASGTDCVVAWMRERFPV